MSHLNIVRELAHCQSNNNPLQGGFVGMSQGRLDIMTSYFGGEDWYKGKRILELGCCYGHVGKRMMDLGAHVTFAEGRCEWEKEIRKVAGENIDFFCIDNDREWDLKKKFDLVIHWGLHYHLKNWERDLSIAARHGDYISLEGEVIEGDDPYAIAVRTEEGPDQSIHGNGVYPTIPCMERHLATLGEFKLFHWPHPGTAGKRAYWMIKTKDTNE